MEWTSGPEGPALGHQHHAAGGRGACAPYYLHGADPLMEKEIGVRVPEDVPPEMQNEPRRPHLTQVCQGGRGGELTTSIPRRSPTPISWTGEGVLQAGQEQEATQGLARSSFSMRMTRRSTCGRYRRSMRFGIARAGGTIGMMTETIRARHLRRADAHARTAKVRLRDFSFERGSENGRRSLFGSVRVRVRGRVRGRGFGWCGQGNCTVAAHGRIREFAAP